MSEPAPEPDVPSPAESPVDTRVSDLSDPPADAALPLPATDEAEDAAPRRSDSLAVGVAVLVMAALLGCAALVLIAAGNA
jgi:hypothetical protein